MLRPLGLMLGFAGVALATPGVADPPSDDVRGPQRLCFKYSSLDLTVDEHVISAEMGIESMQIAVAGKHGAYALGESEIRAEPSDRGKLIQERRDARIYRRSDMDEVSYWIYGRPPFSTDRDRPLVVLSGTALRDEANARAILRHIKIGTPQPEDCGHRYLYGWEYLFQDSQNEQ